MPRLRQDGPKRVVKQLKDGTTWAYLSDRRTGKPIGKEQICKAEEVDVGSMAALIASYRQTARFKSRAPNTQATYGYTLDWIKARMGDVPISAITAKTIQAIKEELRDAPYKANQVLALLSILFELALKQGLIKTNPAADPGKLEVSPRVEVWSRDEEARYMELFRPRLKMLFMLMLYTLQRLSDVLQMSLTQVQEQNGRLYITLRQHKTGELVGIPVHETLAPLLRLRMGEDVTIAEEGTDRQIKSLLLVPSPRGRQWLRRNASRAWDHDLALADARLADELKGRGWVQAKITEEVAKRHRQRRDLRRTGIVRMAEAGCTTPQIAAVSGHQIDYCQRIIDTYLPRKTEVALGGVELWEAGDKAGGRVIRLSDVVAVESRAQKAKTKR